MQNRKPLNADKPGWPTKSPEEKERVQAMLQPLMAELAATNAVKAEGRPESYRNAAIAKREATEWLNNHGTRMAQFGGEKINISPDLDRYFQRAFGIAPE